MVEKEFLKHTVFLGLARKVFRKMITARFDALGSHLRFLFFFLSVSFENGGKFLKWLAHFL